MNILGFYIIPGIVLGLLADFDMPGWFLFNFCVAFMYSVAVMIFELVWGKIKAWVARKQLEDLFYGKPNEVGKQCIEGELYRISIRKQFIYKFHFLAFLAGCLIITVPVSVIAAIVCGIRYWAS